MPAHAHSLGAGTNGNSDAPVSNGMARSLSAVPQFAGTPNTALGPTAVNSYGGDQPHNNLQPYLTLNYIIALQGIFPQRP
jgi:microcystin-dependent protein